VAERHGSIAGYAQAALGLDEAKIAAIRERLVEP